MNFDFFQKLAEEFPESAVTNLFYIFLGSLLTNLFGYVKGIFESKDKRIEAMNDKKLDDILASQKNLEDKMLTGQKNLEDKMLTGQKKLELKINKQGKKTRKQINGLGNRLQAQLDNHEERIAETERQLISTK